MTIQRKIFSATDAAPFVLHGKQAANDEVVYPVLVTTGGSMMISSGLNIPSFDYLDYTDLTNIQFRSGGAFGTLVATISIVGTTLTRT